MILTEWNEDKEKKILKRSKWLLTTKIVRILIIIGVCFYVYMIALSLLIEGTDKNDKDDYFIRVATSMKYPNVFIENGFLQNETVTPFGTRKFSN